MNFFLIDVLVLHVYSSELPGGLIAQLHRQGSFLHTVHASAKEIFLSSDGNVIVKLQTL